ncbi:MAG: HAD family hydrolase [Vulcanimicrobiota bacterium]
MSKYAFFDVDGVLYRGYSLVEFADFLAENGCLDVEQNRVIQEAVAEYQAGRLDYHNGTVMVSRAYSRGLKGQAEEEILHQARNFFEKTYPVNFFPYALKLVEAVRAKGYEVIFVSASPVEIIGEIARNFRAAHIGLISEINNRYYTGEILQNLGFEDAKEKTLARFARERNINLQKSLAFGDSEGDLGMLSLVGLPFPVNPTANLYEFALQKQWYVIEDDSINHEKTVVEIIDKFENCNNCKKIF